MSVLTPEKRKKLIGITTRIIKRHIEKYKIRKISRRKFHEKLIDKLALKFNLRWQATVVLENLFNQIGVDDTEDGINYIFKLMRLDGKGLPKRVSRHVRKRLTYNPVQIAILRGEDWYAAREYWR